MAKHASSVRLLAGGTDLLVDLKTGRIGIDHVVSIGRIEGMRGVDRSADGLSIGALTTLAELVNTALTDDYAPIHDAVNVMAAPQVRNVATIGGNLASAVPCADLPPILIAMNASVTIASARGQRDVSLADFFVGPRETVLGDGEVLVRITVPPPPDRFGAAFHRFSLREGNSIGVASVAASVVFDDAQVIREAILVAGAVAPTPVIVDGAAAGLIGRPLNDDSCQDAADAVMNATRPIGDIRGSAEFRRELCGVLTDRALRSAAQRSER